MKNLESEKFGLYVQLVESYIFECERIKFNAKLYKSKKKLNSIFIYLTIVMATILFLFIPLSLFVFWYFTPSSFLSLILSIVALLLAYIGFDFLKQLVLNKAIQIQLMKLDLLLLVKTLYFITDYAELVCVSYLERRDINANILNNNGKDIYIFENYLWHIDVNLSRFNDIVDQYMRYDIKKSEYLNDSLKGLKLGQPERDYTNNYLRDYFTQRRRKII